MPEIHASISTTAFVGLPRRPSGGVSSIPSLMIHHPSWKWFISAIYRRIQTLLNKSKTEVAAQWNPVEPGGTRWNPAEPGGTRRNPAEPGNRLATMAIITAEGNTGAPIGAPSSQLSVSGATHPNQATKEKRKRKRGANELRPSPPLGSHWPAPSAILNLFIYRLPALPSVTK